MSIDQRIAANELTATLTDTFNQQRAVLRFDLIFHKEERYICWSFDASGIKCAEKTIDKGR